MRRAASERIPGSRTESRKNDSLIVKQEPIISQPNDEEEIK